MRPAAEVERLLQKASAGMHECVMSVVNWGEIYYSVMRGASAEMAETLMSEDVWIYRPEWQLAANDVYLRAPSVLTHETIKDAIATVYAPRRENDDRWAHESVVTFAGKPWFWAGLGCAAGIDENHRLWRLRLALAEAAQKNWSDKRLYAQLIRSAPVLAPKTPKSDLMAHPLIRLIRVRYPDNPIEQRLMVRFLNKCCIEAGVESEEDTFGDLLVLAQWVRNARDWAEQLIDDEPETYASLLCEAGSEAIEGFRRLYEALLTDVHSDSIDVTIALAAWARRVRGFDVSTYRAQLWEFLVTVIDAALWLGWRFPREGKDYGKRT